jgi:hypothetical protein
MSQGSRTSPSRRGTSAHPYLLGRGFSPQTVARVGWRVEPVGDRTRMYGLPPKASETLAWFIPYGSGDGSVRFERLRLIEENAIEGGRHRQPAGRKLELYDPFQRDPASARSRQPRHHLGLPGGDRRGRDHRDGARETSTAGPGGDGARSLDRPLGGRRDLPWRRPLFLWSGSSAASSGDAEECRMHAKGGARSTCTDAAAFRPKRRFAYSRSPAASRAFSRSG